MILDDDRARPKPALFTPPVLDKLSVDECEAYVAVLKAEIVRVEADMARKKAHKSAADALFKKD